MLLVCEAVSVEEAVSEDVCVTVAVLDAVILAVAVDVPVVELVGEDVDVAVAVEVADGEMGAMATPRNTEPAPGTAISVLLFVVAT